MCFCVQGFICPQCMKSHNSAEELFKHYELFHDTGDLPAHMAPTRWDINVLLLSHHSWRSGGFCGERIVVCECAILRFLGKTLLCCGKRFRTCTLLSRWSFWTAEVCKCSVNSNTLFCVSVFPWLGGEVVLWRAQEGVRQSPRTSEASNSFKLFNTFYTDFPSFLHSCLIEHDANAYSYCTCFYLSLLSTERWTDEPRWLR